MPFGLTNEVLLGIIVRLITSITGTLGFSLIFKLRAKRLGWAALGGFTTAIVYELAIVLGAVPMVAAVASSLYMALYSEVFARILRAPAVIFLFLCAIPIVPGRGLYYTIYHLMFYNEAEFLSNAKNTLGIALGIAVGVSFASILIGFITHIAQRFRKTT